MPYGPLMGLSQSPSSRAPLHCFLVRLFVIFAGAANFCHTARPAQLHHVPVTWRTQLFLLPWPVRS